MPNPAVRPPARLLRMAPVLFRMGPVLLCLVTACAPVGPSAAPEGSARFVRPTVAVMKFENRAPFPLNWDLGTGLQDVLVHRLVSTGRYHVVERPEIESVLRELHFEQSGLTRAEERAALGRLKNVQYLIKGTVTDFTHVSTGRGFLGIGGIFGGSGGDSRAVMGVTLYVVDVPSGEIVCSESIEQDVHARDLNVAAEYRDVAFGGSVFYRTPLGEATARVMDRAVARVTAAIGSRPWEPKVARVREDGGVVLNGGRDRELRPGMEFEVLEPGPDVTDPDTGDVIGHEAGGVVGRLRVGEVQERFSTAAVVAGQASAIRVGRTCRPVAAAAGN